MNAKLSDSLGFGYGVASPDTPPAAPPVNEPFTVVLPAGVAIGNAWRPVSARRQSGTWTGRALEGFDAGCLYLECPLAVAQEIAREVRAVKLSKGWACGERRAMAFWLCENCFGSGVYRWGPCVNGKPPAHSGPCFRCESKGYQDDADRRRNFGYDNHRRVF